MSNGENARPPLNTIAFLYNWNADQNQFLSRVAYCDQTLLAANGGQERVLTVHLPSPFRSYFTYGLPPHDFLMKAAVYLIAKYRRSDEPPALAGAGVGRDMDLFALRMRLSNNN